MLQPTKCYISPQHRHWALTKTTQRSVASCDCFHVINNLLILLLSDQMKEHWVKSKVWKHEGSEDSPEENFSSTKNLQKDIPTQLKLKSSLGPFQHKIWMRQWCRIIRKYNVQQNMCLPSMLPVILIMWFSCNKKVLCRWINFSRDTNDCKKLCGHILAGVL